jgi:hypothetical protein
MFRESCGVDSFGGVDVTPAYWKQPYSGTPESLAAIVETSNNFYKRFLLNASAFIASTVHGKVIPHVPMRSGAQGWRTRTKLLPNDLRSRWNRNLQRAEVWIDALQVRQDRLPAEGNSAVLQYFTEAPDPYSKWKSGIPQRPETKVRRRWVAVQDLQESCES